MKCKKCGWQVPDHSGSCPNCGYYMQSSLGSTLRRRLTIDESNSGRLVGVALGILAIFLTWGGLFVKEKVTLLAVTSMNWSAVDLLQSPDIAVSLGTVLFLVGTVASILESKAFVVQMTGLVMVAFSLHSFMQSSLPESIASDPTLMSYSSFAIGFYLAWLSALVVFSSGVLERYMAKTKIVKGSLPASENERWNPRYWSGRWRR